METIKNVTEYYDELYTISKEQRDFFSELASEYPIPVKFLRVGCGTGLFEHQLAKDGADVTGIEEYQELIHSANLRRRTQLMSIHYFQMSALDMTHFLGKGFYNIISSLENRIVFMHDQTLIRKFFFDTRKMINENGTLVISLYNYNMFNEKNPELPIRESIRTSMHSQISRQPNEEWVLNQWVETGNGKLMPVYKNEKIYPLTAEEIDRYAKEAGYTDVKFYSSYDKSPFTGNEENVIAVIK
ncbi:MAG: methyltransferase domain-containing protein [Treponema sp.]|nr:methyltransferase domain-containing protein [Treponema sp.]MBQ5384804.1 methyltransferase domain-containing protein [Treponema sp.]